jgi:hypothetical protein
MSIDRRTVALDRLDDIGRRPQPLVRDGGVECRQIDRPHRLGTEHERIVSHAFAVDMRFHRELADAIEARLRGVLDAAVEQMDGGEIARVLQRPAQRENAAATAVVVLRRPIVLLAGAAAADGRQRDRLVTDEGVGLQPPA